MILDCTIRDGGYYNNWNFSKETIKKYFEAVNKLPIDVVEVGYRTPKKEVYHELGEYFYTPKSTIDFIKENCLKETAIMLNFKDIDSLHTLKDCVNDLRGRIDWIRLAVHPDELDKVAEYAIELKYVGFKVALNLMYMSDWSVKYNHVFDEFSKLEGIDYFYMVDSFGSVTPNQVKEIYTEVREALPDSIKIGFHGHNNIEMALMNSITAKEIGVDIIDSTVMGMGRGAGNLKTELLLTYLNKNENLDLSYDYLSLLNESFLELYEQYSWGTQLPYMVSGAFSLPQKKVMEWVTTRSYSFDSIIRGLFNKTSNCYEDISNVDFDINSETALIIGGGNSVVSKIHDILQFINKNKSMPVIMASTRYAHFFTQIENPIFYCLVGNEGIRLNNHFIDINQNAIAVLPEETKMGNYVPTKLRNNTFSINVLTDSPTEIGFQLANRYFNSSKYFLLGYDGYEKPNEVERKLESENENIFENFTEFTEIVSLLPTKYNKLKVESLYSLL